MFCDIFKKEQICHQHKLKWKPRLLVSSAVCGEDGPGGDLGECDLAPAFVGLPASLNTSESSCRPGSIANPRFVPALQPSAISLGSSRLEGKTFKAVVLTLSSPACLRDTARKGRKRYTPPRVCTPGSHWPTTILLPTWLTQLSELTWLNTEYLSFGCAFIIS